MVADALEILCDHQKIEALAAQVRVLGDLTDQLVFHGVEQAVDDVVLLLNGTGLAEILADEGVDAVRDHAAGGAGHFIDVRARLELLILDVAGDARDVRGLVADALQIGDHFQGRGDRAQVARNGLLLQQELHTQALDLALLVVALQRGRLFGALLVRFIFQRVHGSGDRVLAQRAHFNQFPVEQLQLLVKADAHQPNLPVM